MSGQGPILHLTNYSLGGGRTRTGPLASQNKRPGSQNWRLGYITNLYLKSIQIIVQCIEIHQSPSSSLQNSYRTRITLYRL